MPSSLPSVVPKIASLVHSGFCSWPASNTPTVNWSMAQPPCVGGFL